MSFYPAHPAKIDPLTLCSALSATVNHFMKEHNLSVSDVAKRCDLSVSTVRRVVMESEYRVNGMTGLKLTMGIGVALDRFYDVLMENYTAIQSDPESPE